MGGHFDFSWVGTSGKHIHNFNILLCNSSPKVYIGLDISVNGIVNCSSHNLKKSVVHYQDIDQTLPKLNTKVNKT